MQLKFYILIHQEKKTVVESVTIWEEVGGNSCREIIYFPVYISTKRINNSCYTRKDVAAPGTGNY